MKATYIILTYFIASFYTFLSVDESKIHSIENQSQNDMTLIFTIEYSGSRKIDSLRTFIMRPSRAEVYAKKFINGSQHFDYIFQKYINPKMITKSKNAILRELLIKDGQWSKEQESIYLSRKSKE